MFNPEKKYKRSEVWENFNLSEELTKGGAYATGYAWVQNNLAVFVNINVAGRTGHDYQNEFIGDELIWWSKTNRTKNSPEIKKMLMADSKIFVFFRNEDTSLWSFWGQVKVVGELLDRKIKGKNGKMVSCVTMKLALVNIHDAAQYGDYDGIPEYVEGKSKAILVNIYERNPAARRACLDYHGTDCKVCGISFKDSYPGIGEGFIHVHHLRMISDVDNERKINPAEDLIPVCPNCHAMMHKRKTPYTVEELKAIMASAQ